ncbi:MAG: carbohydrate ABC transporter permease [Roseiflexus sp.]|nr:carbohydrate ABC transporter permease [Roseiflexus sp.]MCS7290941.1 carbohydrate ABC transporter permease [Roseiflexus sp.]MDW8145320.1 carbohydrate ABC transporter permease [Roseiflexaceae bacterium]MDW8233517.1 carbohydrate ABC transporter permease [Roseiflexaceae bacterium]
MQQRRRQRVLAVRRGWLWRIAGYAAIAISVVVIGLPIYWMFIASLKTSREIYTVPPTWIPLNPTLENYPAAWEAAPFARYYINSIIVTAVTTLSKMTLAVLTAYALVFLRFPGKNLVFLTVLAALMVPAQITIVPNFLTMGNLGLVNTYWGLILPGAATAFGTFLMRQYFMTLPREVFEAAEIDGAGHMRRLWAIAVPLAMPALVTTGIFAVVNEWNEFLWPLIITSTEDMRTLPIGVARLLDQEGLARWGVVMAGTVFVVLPVIVLFVWAQRYIVEGIAAGAVKG